MAWHGNLGGLGRSGCRVKRSVERESTVRQTQKVEFYRTGEEGKGANTKNAGQGNAQEAGSGRVTVSASA